MADELEYRDYRPGEMVFAEGEMGDEAFIVDDGRVEVTKGKDGVELVLTTLDPGQMIGEMALVDPAPRSATVRAMQKTRMIVIPKKVFDKALAGTNPVIRLVLTTVLRRLREETTKNVKGTFG